MVIRTPRFHDHRGYFCQQWTSRQLEEMGFRPGFLQVNSAMSSQGVLRGMHRQDQAKFVQVLAGRIFDVILNPETGEWRGFDIGEGDSLYVSRQFAHGYLVLSETALVQYAVDAPYQPEKEETFPWNRYGIEWPLSGTPILSAKDCPT